MISHRLVLLLACAPLFGQQYTISTIAGGTTTSGLLHNPAAVAVDLAGNVYFGDWNGFIRKVWARDGAITIVAGTGVLGYSGDGGQATSAMLGKPASLALDASGNLYIADGENNRIRVVSLSTGIITAVAGTGSAIDSGDGGPALSAGVSQPTGITINSAGDLYFSSGWSRVRKLTAGTGKIETVAGHTVNGFSGDNGPAVDALFWDPVPSAVDRLGNVYIADFENSRIRRLEASTGTVTTIVGTGECIDAPGPLRVAVCQSGFGGDRGAAVNATLHHAEALALDTEGNIYIADTINHRIRRVDASTGLISTIAGTGTSGFSGDGGPALAADITFPAGIAVDSSGKVYFSDESNNRIRVLTQAEPQLYRTRPGLRPLALPRISPISKQPK